ncbi:MAG: carboxypeptidase regulatory-like domain-containing protein [Candidatus Cloacimonetes bacterium]|nr:carboxypeptidase regulatory-like domain-containing protein [Candidatus Cloacimonadota bacterium]MCK4358318.1 carboxypeptidase regulatory-like domain-containing protein [Candidatus Cloacimonadota bacterium]
MKKLIKIKEDKMKRIITILLVTLLSASLSFAQTHIPAGNVSGTWNFAGSPYIIDGEIQIQIGDTLIIEPGVDIQFSGHYKFIINGRLLAEGTAGNLITFSAQVPATGWHGLRFIDTNTNGQDSSKIVYCTLEHGIASGDASSGGAIYLESSDIIIENSSIFDNEADGYGGGIYMYDSNPRLTSVDIYENSAIHEGGGIMCFNANPFLEKVAIYENETQWSGGGICSYGTSVITLENVTLSDNEAFQDGSGIASLYGSDITLLNCIVWDNPSEEIYIHPDATLNATYSDIKNGTGQTYFGTGCIDINPFFADPANNLYSITWANFPDPDYTKSPCIDTGNPDVQYNDLDGTRNDMGAYYFPQSGIQGTITLAGGSGNVENVIVSAISATDTTNTSPDASGDYIVNVVPGTYTVSATLDGYSGDPVTNVIVVTGQVVIGIDIQLDEILPGSINGLVALEGLGDVTAVLISAGGETTNPYAVYVGPDIDHYEYDLEIDAGTYDVVATLAGYQNSTVTNVVVQSGQQTTNVDFLLLLIHYEGYIAGRVTLKEGAGNVENVEVTVDTIIVNPDANGDYLVTIDNGTYDLTASLDNYATLTFSSIEVVADDTTEVDITLMNWEVITGTQYNMIAYITATLDGAFIDGSNSNQLAALGPGGDCRGIASWNTGSHPYWDETSHYWALDGYWYCTIVSDDNSGTEVISFKVYDTATDLIYSPPETLLFVDGTNNNVVDLYAPSPSHDLEFDLIEDWNWISFNLKPADNSIVTVFDVLDDVPDIYQVKNQTHSSTYINPGGWIGDLNNLTVGDGFKVSMINAYNDFIFSGTKLNPILTPIALDSLWNWVAYVPQNSLTLESAIISIAGNISVIKNQTQSAVYDGSWVGDLTNMYPGISYLIYMSESDSLTYPANTTTTRSSDEPEISSNYANWKLLSGTEHNMIVMAKLLNNDNTILSPEEYTVGIFNEDNICHSIGKYVGDFWYFTVVGNDETENLHFRIYHNQTGITANSDETISYERDIIIGNCEEPIEMLFNNPISISSQTLQLNQNYPNPFNPSTVISYSLPKAGFVNLSIYNIKGQLVETLVNTHQEADNYTVEWKADKYSSGIYFFKVSSGGHSQVKKCLLIK